MQDVFEPPWTRSMHIIKYLFARRTKKRTGFVSPVFETNSKRLTRSISRYVKVIGTFQNPPLELSLKDLGTSHLHCTYLGSSENAYLDVSHNFLDFLFGFGTCKLFCPCFPCAWYNYQYALRWQNWQEAAHHPHTSIHHRYKHRGSLCFRLIAKVITS